MTSLFSDLSALRLDTLAIAPGVTEVLTHVPVRKPTRNEFFRVRPGREYQFETLVYVDKEERETYFISPDMRSSLVGEEKAVLLVTGITRQGTVFIWPVALPNPDGRRNTWTDSAHEAVRHAESAWVRLVADMGMGAYRIYKAEGQLTEPVWPDRPFSELLEIAFNNRVIDNPDHAIVRRLRGLA